MNELYEQLKSLIEKLYEESPGMTPGSMAHFMSDFTEQIGEAMLAKNSSNQSQGSW